MKRKTNIETIVLIPITEAEKEYCERIKKHKKHLYILYRKPNRGGIQIKSIKENDREIMDKAYFYGVESLKKVNIDNIIDRPIYKVYTKGNRTIENYEILNDISIHSTDIWLDNIINGSYKVEDYDVKKRIKKE